MPTNIAPIIILKNNKKITKLLTLQFISQRPSFCHYPDFTSISAYQWMVRKQKVEYEIGY